MKRRTHPFLLHLAVLLLFATAATATPKDYDSSNTRLFHVERSKNRNIVCYDANTTPTGGLDMDNPLKVYWINKEDRPGERNGLNALQRRLAFGYKVQHKNYSSTTIALNGCKDHPINIEKNASNKYVCVTSINQQPSLLYKVYVKTKDSNSLSVEYIELSGVSLVSGTAVSERITH